MPTIYGCCPGAPFQKSNLEKQKRREEKRRHRKEKKRDGGSERRKGEEAPANSLPELPECSACM
jgi:hypothetical protein